MVRVCNNTSAWLILNTGAPQGCVLSPLLYFLFTNDCMAEHDSNTIIKFADDTTVVGLITDNDETAYREEVRDLAGWYQNNNLSLNVTKTKELIVDYRKRRTEHAPILIDGAVVEQVEFFKFLGVHINNKLEWSKHTKTVVKRARKNLDHQKVLQLQHREHPDQLHHCLLRQLLCLRPQGTSEGSAYRPVHHWGKAACHPGTLHQAVSEEGAKNCQRPQPP